MPSMAIFFLIVLLSGAPKSSLYTEYTIFDLAKRGSSENALLMIKGAKAVIQPWQCTMFGDQRNLRTVSTTPLLKNTARSSLSSYGIPVSFKIGVLRWK